MNKSAAKFKPIKNENSSKFLKQPELPPIEETFDNAKQAFILTADVAVTVSKRVTNLVNIRRAAKDFWGSTLDELILPSDRIGYFKDLHEMIVSVYEDIADIVKTFELDEFLKEDMKDYFEQLIPSTEDIKDEEGLFEAYLIVDVVKPWGEKMTALHHQMLEEAEARKPISDDIKEIK